MNDYGLIVGANDNIQFDTKRQMLGLMGHGYLTFSGIYEITTDYIPAAIAVRPINLSAIIGWAGSASGQYNVKLWAPFVGGETTYPIEYAIYSPDANNVIALPTWGMVTYDENGNVVFNSNIRYLKIVDIIDVDRSAILNLEDVTINHSIENPFYIVPYTYCQVWGYVSGPGGGGAGVYFYRLCILKLSSTSAKVKWYLAGRTPPVSGSMGTNKFSVPNPLRIAVCVL